MRGENTQHKNTTPTLSNKWNTSGLGWWIVLMQVRFWSANFLTTVITSRAMLLSRPGGRETIKIIYATKYDIEEREFLFDINNYKLIIVVNESKFPQIWKQTKSIDIISHTTHNIQRIYTNHKQNIPLVGSSRKIRLGMATISTAIDKRFSCPPEIPGRVEKKKNDNKTLQTAIIMKTEQYSCNIIISNHVVENFPRYHLN